MTISQIITRLKDWLRDTTSVYTDAQYLEAIQDALELVPGLKGDSVVSRDWTSEFKASSGNPSDVYESSNIDFSNDYAVLNDPTESGYLLTNELANEDGDVYEKDELDYLAGITISANISGEEDAVFFDISVDDRKTYLVSTGLLGTIVNNAFFNISDVFVKSNLSIKVTIAANANNTKVYNLRVHLVFLRYIWREDRSNVLFNLSKIYFLDKQREVAKKKSNWEAVKLISDQIEDIKLEASGKIGRGSNNETTIENKKTGMLIKSQFPSTKNHWKGVGDIS